MNPWKPIAFVSFAAFATALAIACTPAAPPGPAACNNQPSMASAVGSLRSARGYLDRAEHNKGGWRDAAIQATDQAIVATVRGCQFADTH